MFIIKLKTSSAYYNLFQLHLFPQHVSNKFVVVSSVIFPPAHLWTATNNTLCCIPWLLSTKSPPWLATSLTMFHCSLETLVMWCKLCSKNCPCLLCQHGASVLLSNQQISYTMITLSSLLKSNIITVNSYFTFF